MKLDKVRSECQQVLQKPLGFAMILMIITSNYTRICYDLVIIVSRERERERERQVSVAILAQVHI